MRCTDCGREVRPVVAIDIDGTLGDYHLHFIKFASDYLGLSFTPPNRRLSMPLEYDGSVNFGNWVERAFGIDRKTYREAKLAYRQGGWKRTMPLFSGAQALCSAVRAAGAELWLTTSRPYMRLDNVDPDTRNWLDRNDIEFDYLLYDESKYSELRERVEPGRVVAVLDDLPECLLAAEAEFGPHVPIKRETTWNKNAGWDGWAVGSLPVAGAEIVNRIDGWKEIAA